MLRLRHKAGSRPPNHARAPPSAAGGHAHDLSPRVHVSNAPPASIYGIICCASRLTHPACGNPACTAGAIPEERGNDPPPGHYFYRSGIDRFICAPPDMTSSSVTSGLHNTLICSIIIYPERSIQCYIGTLLQNYSECTFNYLE